MFKSDLKDVNSLVQFIQDVKPFHTKLTNITVDYQYDDSLNVGIDDSEHHFNIGLSSHWDKKSPNTKSRMTGLADGSVKYKKWRLPAAVFPRYSIDTDKLQPSGNNLGIGYQYRDPVFLPYDSEEIHITNVKQLFEYSDVLAEDGFDITEYDITEDLVYTTTSTFDNTTQIIYKKRDPKYLDENPKLQISYGYTFFYSDLIVEDYKELTAYVNRQFIDGHLYHITPWLNAEGERVGSKISIHLESEIIIEEYQKQVDLGNGIIGSKSFAKFGDLEVEFDKLFFNKEITDQNLLIESLAYGLAFDEEYVFVDGFANPFGARIPIRSTPSHQVGVKDEITIPQMKVLSTKIEFTDIEYLTVPNHELIEVDNGLDLLVFDDDELDEDGQVRVLKQENPSANIKYRIHILLDRDVTTMPNLIIYNTKDGVQKVLVKNVDYVIAEPNKIVVTQEDFETFDLVSYPSLADAIDFSTNELINEALFSSIVSRRFLTQNQISFTDGGSRTYRIPYNDAVVVHVNGVEKHLNTDYVISTPDRAYVTFLAGREPKYGDTIQFNLFNFDRIFIRYIPEGGLVGSDEYLARDGWLSYFIHYDSTVLSEIDGQLAFDVYTIDQTFFDQAVYLSKPKTKSEAMIHETSFREVDINGERYVHLGSLKVVNDIYDHKYYVFEFSFTPKAGDRIEFQVEQYNTYRGWTQTSFAETLTFADRVKFRDQFNILFSETIKFAETEDYFETINVLASELMFTNVDIQHSTNISPSILDSLWMVDSVPHSQLTAAAISDSVSTKFSDKYFDSFNASVTDVLRIRFDDEYTKFTGDIININMSDEYSTMFGNGEVDVATSSVQDTISFSTKDYYAESFSVGIVEGLRINTNILRLPGLTDTAIATITDAMEYDVGYKLFDLQQTTVSDRLVTSIDPFYTDTMLVRGPVDGLNHAGFDTDRFSDSEFSGITQTPADVTAITSLADSVSFVVKTRIGPEEIFVADGFDVISTDSELFDNDGNVLVQNNNFVTETIVTADLGTDLVYLQLTDANKLYLIIPSTIAIDTVDVYALSIDGSNSVQISPDVLNVESEQIVIEFNQAQKFKVVVTVVA